MGSSKGLETLQLGDLTLGIHMREIYIFSWTGIDEAIPEREF